MTIFKFGLTGWREISFETQHTAKPFRCPECKTDVFPQNMLHLVCGNCGADGTKQHFSAIVKKAA
jgi:hypothetical protein